MWSSSPGKLINPCLIAHRIWIGNSMLVSWEVVYQQLWFHSAARFKIVQDIIDAIVSFQMSGGNNDLTSKGKMLKVVLKALYSTLLTMLFNGDNKRPVNNEPHISGSICHLMNAFLVSECIFLIEKWIVELGSTEKHSASQTLMENVICLCQLLRLKDKKESKTCTLNLYKY